MSNAYKFFNEIVAHIEDIQGTLNELRNVVKQRIAECASPKEDKPNE